jgi:hypothetical protein
MKTFMATALLLAFALLTLAACSNRAAVENSDETISAYSSEANELSQPEISVVSEPPEPPSSSSSSAPSSSAPKSSVAPSELTEPASSQSEAPQQQLTDTAMETELDPYQIYYDFFSNNFELVGYQLGYWAPSWFWSHTAEDEVRLTKIVMINQINGFDHPVLVLAEYTLEQDGGTIDLGRFNAYLIKNGELTNDMERPEFDAIFTLAEQSEGGSWSANYEDETLISVKVNGENLFYVDMAGNHNDGTLESDFERVLDWLVEAGN